MDYRLPSLLCGVGLVLFCQNSSAQNDTVIHREIEQVDVTANNKKQQLTLSQSLSRNQIEVLGVKTITDALRMFSGTNIKDYGGIGGLKTVSVRSLGAAHTAVDYDGIPVSNTQAGPVDISRFDINQISDLKFTIGSDENLLKPAKLFASAGVLSINTIKPQFQNHDYTFNLNFKTGSFGYNFVNAAYAKLLSKNLSIKTEGEFMRADGVYDFTLVNYSKVTKERRNNSDINSAKAEINLYYNDSSRNDVNVKAYAYYSDRGLPGGVILYNPKSTERLNDANYFFQTNFKHRWSYNFTTRVIAKYNYSFNHYEETDVKYKDGKLSQNSTQNEYYVSLINMWQIFSSLTSAISFDEAYNTLDSDISPASYPKRYTFLTSLSLKYNLHNTFTVLANCIYNSVREKVENGNSMSDIDRFLPFVTLRFSPFYNKNIAMRLMYKNTYRVPTFNELYYTTLGTTGLKPEDAQEFTLGFDYSSELLAFTIDVYKNYVDKKIVAIPTTYVWKMYNYGKVTMDGIDVNITKNIDFKSLKFSFQVGYSYQDVLDKTDKNSKYYNSQIPYSPKHSGNYVLASDCKWFQLGYHCIWSGKRYFLKYNIPENLIDKYMEHTISVTKNFNLRNSKLMAKFSCINFTDEQYDIIKYYPMPGRQWQLQLTLSI